MQSVPLLFQVGLLVLALVLPTQPATGSMQPRTPQLVRSPEQPRVPVAPKPKVEVFGCLAVRETLNGRYCMMTPESELTIWVDSKCSEIQASEDGESIPAEMRTVRNGCQVHPWSSRHSEMSALAIADKRSQPLEIITIDRSHPHLLERTRRILARSDVDVELSVVGLLHERPNDSWDRFDVSFALGLCYARIGSEDLARTYFIQAVSLALPLGATTVGLDAMLHQAKILINSGMRDEALSILGEVRLKGDGLGPLGAEILLRTSDIEGSMFYSQERFADAEQRWLAGSVAAEKSGDLAGYRARTIRRLNMFAFLDKNKEAEEIISQLDSLVSNTSACERSRILTIAGFAGIVLVQGRIDPHSNATVKVGTYIVKEILSNALESIRLCRDDYFLVHVYNGLAWVSFFEGKLDEAAKWVKRGYPLSGRDAAAAFELQELSAYILTAQGHTALAQKQLDNLSKQLTVVTASYRQDFLCRVAMGYIELFTTMGQSAPSYLSEVNRCLDPNVTSLAPAARRWLLRRAQNAGIQGKQTPI